MILQTDLSVTIDFYLILLFFVCFFVLFSALF